MFYFRRMILIAKFIDGFKQYDFETKKWKQIDSFEKFNFSEELKKETIIDFTEEQRKSLSLPFFGTKILCVGRNYCKHAEEMGNEMPVRPLWFTKPLSSLLADGGNIEIPMGFGQIDYEGELALVIKKKCRNVDPSKAGEFIFGIIPALDITARELQKKDGQWTRAKGFDTFCPLGPVIAPWDSRWNSAGIKTLKNGKIVQQDSLSSLAFDFETLISDISNCMTLERGDLILTGTPAGVGPIVPGDHLEVHLEGPTILELSANCI